jgi:soluble lytic murein transglycosylase-like protein
VSTLSLLVLKLFLQSFDPEDVPPDVEIVAWSFYYQVDPHVSLAVAGCESGSVPEADGSRDRVVSQGNYGRFQVRCKTWKNVFALAGCDRLLDRHTNIRIGVSILRRIQDTFAGRHAFSGDLAWVGHYNEGVVLTLGGPGQAYAQRVQARVRRSQILARRRFGNFRGW